MCAVTFDKTFCINTPVYQTFPVSGRFRFEYRSETMPQRNSDQAAVGFVFECRSETTPPRNSDQASVGFGFGCRREATLPRNSDQADVGFDFGCCCETTPPSNLDQAAVCGVSCHSLQTTRLCSSHFVNIVHNLECHRESKVFTRELSTQS